MMKNGWLPQPWVGLTTSSTCRAVLEVVFGDTLAFRQLRVGGVELLASVAEWPAWLTIVSEHISSMHVQHSKAAWDFVEGCGRELNEQMGQSDDGHLERLAGWAEQSTDLSDREPSNDASNSVVELCEGLGRIFGSATHHVRVGEVLDDKAPEAIADKLTDGFVRALVRA